MADEFFQLAVIGKAKVSTSFSPDASGLSRLDGGMNQTGDDWGFRGMVITITPESPHKAMGRGKLGLLCIITRPRHSPAWVVSLLAIVG